MNMKKLFYILILFPLLFVACFDDDSNMDIHDLNPIVIELEGSNQLYVKQMDTLKVGALVYCNGVPDSLLSYEWKLLNKDIVPRILDTNMYCCAQVSEPPANGYTLRLTVTDKTTGIFRIQSYNLNIEANFSEGLLIADTRDGGAHSDLNLVMSREFSTNRAYQMENETRDIYYEMWKKVNGYSFDGKLKTALTRYNYQKHFPVTAITDQEVYQGSFKTYVEWGKGSDIFFVPPDFIGQPIESASSFFADATKSEILIVNGRYYFCGQNETKYGLDAEILNNPDYYITHAYKPAGQYGYDALYGYDKTNKRMLFFVWGNGYQLDEQTNTSGKFNVNDLSDYEILHIGECAEGVALVAKEISTGKNRALVMKKVDPANTIPQETKIAKAAYDLGTPANFDKAIAYAMGSKGNAIYYATEHEVYAGPVDNYGTVKVQWTPEPGETITGMQMYIWKGGKHYYEDPEKEEKAIQDSEERLLLVFTCTGNGEGKVTAVPVTHTNIGALEQNRKYHVVLEGFGEILGAYKQLNY